MQDIVVATSYLYLRSTYFYYYASKQNKKLKCARNTLVGVLFILYSILLKQN